MTTQSPAPNRAGSVTSSRFPLGLHWAIGWAGVITTLALIGFYVPSAERTIGESYLIFFFHFPSAVNCLNFFVIAGFVSLIYLLKPSASADWWAASAVEVGLLACSVTLVTGSLWAKAAWGVYWDVQDPRLMSVAIMWLTFAGYIALRSTIEEPTRRALFSAVFGVIAAINVPIVYYSIQWFGVSHHPMKVDLAAREMIITRWTGAAVFFVVYAAYWRLRRQVHEEMHEVRALEDAFGRAGI